MLQFLEEYSCQLGIFMQAQYSEWAVLKLHTMTDLKLICGVEYTVYGPHMHEAFTQKKHNTYTYVLVTNTGPNVFTKYSTYILL
jgi:hypothetical protein